MKHLKTRIELNEKKSEEKNLELGDLSKSVNLNKQYNWDGVPQSAKSDDRWYANANKSEIAIGDGDPVAKFKEWSGKYWRYKGEEKLKYEPRSGVDQKSDSTNKNFKEKSLKFDK